jgi:hypothetical protein
VGLSAISEETVDRNTTKMAVSEEAEQDSRND